MNERPAWNTAPHPVRSDEVQVAGLRGAAFQREGGHLDELGLSGVRVP